jgi:TolB protein
VWPSTPTRVQPIIKAGLERSGTFRIIDAGVVNDLNTIDHSGWKAKGAAALVPGSVNALADGRARGAQSTLSGILR